jgi:hypothetical protein
MGLEGRELCLVLADRYSAIVTRGVVEGRIFLMNEAIWLEWLSYIWGGVVHPYVDRTAYPLVSWCDYGMGFTY